MCTSLPWPCGERAQLSVCVADCCMPTRLAAGGRMGLVVREPLGSTMAAVADGWSRVEQCGSTLEGTPTDQHLIRGDRLWPATMLLQGLVLKV